MTAAGIIQCGTLICVHCIYFEESPGSTTWIMYIIINKHVTRDIIKDNWNEKIHRFFSKYNAIRGNRLLQRQQISPGTPQMLKQK